MNAFTITGKIWDIRPQAKVDYITVVCRDGKRSDWIDVTIFKNPFFSRYFTKGSWISIQGYIHKSTYNGVSRLELIADKIYFAGDPPTRNTNTAIDDFTDIDTTAAEDKLPWDIQAPTA